MAVLRDGQGAVAAFLEEARDAGSLRAEHYGDAAGEFGVGEVLAAHVGGVCPETRFLEPLHGAGEVGHRGQRHPGYRACRRAGDGVGLPGRAAFRYHDQVEAERVGRSEYGAEVVGVFYVVEYGDDGFFRNAAPEPCLEVEFGSARRFGKRYGRAAVLRRKRVEFPCSDGPGDDAGLRGKLGYFLDARPGRRDQQGGSLGLARSDKLFHRVKTGDVGHEGIV